MCCFTTALHTAWVGHVHRNGPLIVWPLVLKFLFRCVTHFQKIKYSCDQIASIAKCLFWFMHLSWKKTAFWQPWCCPSNFPISITLCQSGWSKVLVRISRGLRNRPNDFYSITFLWTRNNTGGCKKKKSFFFKMVFMHNLLQSDKVLSYVSRVGCYSAL